MADLFFMQTCTGEKIALIVRDKGLKRRKWIFGFTLLANWIRL